MKGRVGRGSWPNRLEWHSHERPLSPDGTEAILLCDVCGAPKWWPVSTIAYTCRECWEHYQVGDTRHLCAGCMEWYWIPCGITPDRTTLCRDCRVRAYSTDSEHDDMNPGPFSGAETVTDNEVAE